MLTKLRSNSYRQEGQAALEFAIVVPVLVFLIMGVIDLGMVINQYLALTNIAYEGARYGSSLAGLSSNSLEGSSETAQQKKDKIRERILELISGNPIFNENQQTTALADVYYEQLLPEGEESSGDTAANTIRVSITIFYDPFFPVFNKMPVTVTMTAPYLFKDNEVSGS